MIKPQTLKGFRDFLPQEARKRQFVINTLKKVFESYGFEPLETPSLEYEEILLGKYGDEGDKLMYRFVDNGKRKVALRYDQTVPLARVVAQYGSASSPQVLPMPFKRYQIQNVWRAENTQKGRYREFLQCDADIVGMSTSLADAEILSLVLEIYKNLKLDVTIKINDRTNFENLNKKIIAAIDKLEKVGESTVLSEMVEKGMTSDDAKLALTTLQEKPITENIKPILKYLKMMGQDVSKVKYEPTLARGLDYYTGIIFETVVKNSAGSICSGGRYDNLIGMFGNNQPAIGFGLGFDRTIELLEENGLLPDLKAPVKVLVTVFSENLIQKSLEIINFLDENKIPCELWLDPNSKMEKQLKYADQKGIPFVVIIGPDEAAKNMVTLKNMKTRSQKTIAEKNIFNEITI
ncbi:MAG: histidine--tRNA ligase [Candidatus Levybacteria bacterium]|nr:histidine--tRNA ligase [Candidatus Levybacteria bacterium]